MVALERSSPGRTYRQEIACQHLRIHSVPVGVANQFEGTLEIGSIERSITYGDVPVAPRTNGWT